MSRHDMFSPGRNDDPPTWRWCTYTRADLVRAILGQQWAVAITVLDGEPTTAWDHIGGGAYLSPNYASTLAMVLASLPSPDDVVTAMEQV